MYQRDGALTLVLIAQIMHRVGHENVAILLQSESAEVRKYVEWRIGTDEAGIGCFDVEDGSRAVAARLTNVPACY